MNDATWADVAVMLLSGGLFLSVVAIVAWVSIGRPKGMPEEILGHATFIGFGVALSAIPCALLDVLVNHLSWK